MGDIVRVGQARCLVLLVMASPGGVSMAPRRGPCPVAHGASKKLIFGQPTGTDWSGALPAVVPCAHGDPGTGKWDRQRGDRCAPPQGCLFGEFGWGTGLNDNLDVEDCNTCETPVYIISYRRMYYPGSL